MSSLDVLVKLITVDFALRKLLLECHALHLEHLLLSFLLICDFLVSVLSHEFVVKNFTAGLGKNESEAKQHGHAVDIALFLHTFLLN